nr:MAG TPA: repressor protein [Caudoviricetes sp.]
MNKNALFTMQNSGYFPRVEALSRVADYLDCSVDYLLGRTDRKEVNR